MKGIGGSMHGKPHNTQRFETTTNGSVTPPGIPVTPATVARKRATAFRRILRTLLQQQSYFLPETGTYLLPQFSLRLQSIDGLGINPNTLAGYLRGNIFPSERKVRLMADALEVPRGVLLFAAGYLRLEDLPDYPGAHTTLDAVLADIEEIEQSPLSALAKTHILQGLRNTARILRMLNGERAREQWSVLPNERELLIEHMTLLWDSPAPVPARYTYGG
jgi:transcriptional regulator with XRE-family HTH domain